MNNRDYVVDFNYSEEDWEILDFPQIKKTEFYDEDDDMIYYKHKKEKDLNGIRVK